MKLSNLPEISSVDLAGGAVALLLTTVFCAGVLKPLHDKTSQASANAAADARDRQRLVTLKAAIQAMYDDVAQMNSKMLNNPVRLLSLSRLNTRLAGITSLAMECNLSIQDLKPGEAAVTSHCTTVPILMTGSGNYRDVAGMIHLLHERLPDVAVNAFRLIGTIDQAGYNCNFELQLEWRAALEAPGGAALQATADLRQ